MKLEETIQEMFDEYPDLFQTRSQCLDHLFCVIGNGYDWVNGQLIEPHMKSPKTGRYIKKRGEYLKFKGCLGKDGKATQRIRIEQRCECEWYPLCRQYSYLFDFPKNIKKDWLEGIKETMEILINTIDESDDIFGEVSKVQLSERYGELFN